MVFPERLAAGPKARHGPQTERRAKSWNRCIACPNLGEAVWSQPSDVTPSVNMAEYRLQLATSAQLLQGRVKLACTLTPIHGAIQLMIANL